MNETSIPKRKMSKWIKIPLITFGVLIVLIYGYIQIAFVQLYQITSFVNWIT